jgi:regulator of sigma E protease
MNLLPIPVLDGGQVVFLLWEVVTGRKPSDNFMAIAMNIGLYMVLALMLYALGLDLMRAFL